MAQVTRDFDKPNEPPIHPPNYEQPLLDIVAHHHQFPPFIFPHLTWEMPKRSEEDPVAVASCFLFSSFFFHLFIWLLCFHIWWEGINQSWKGIIPPFFCPCIWFLFPIPHPLKNRPMQSSILFLFRTWKTKWNEPFFSLFFSPSFSFCSSRTRGPLPNCLHGGY